MTDRLFDGFSTAEVSGIFEAAHRAAKVMEEKCPVDNSVKISVSGFEQGLYLHTQGVVVCIKHEVGEELVITVHHNRAYPGMWNAAYEIAAVLGVGEAEEGS